MGLTSLLLVQREADEREARELERRATAHAEVPVFPPGGRPEALAKLVAAAHAAGAHGIEFTIYQNGLLALSDGQVASLYREACEREERLKEFAAEDAEREAADAARAEAEREAEAAAARAEAARAEAEAAAKAEAEAQAKPAEAPPAEEPSPESAKPKKDGKRR